MPIIAHAWPIPGSPAARRGAGRSASGCTWRSPSRAVALITAGLAYLLVIATPASETPSEQAAGARGRPDASASPTSSATDRRERRARPRSGNHRPGLLRAWVFDRRRPAAHARSIAAGSSCSRSRADAARGPAGADREPRTSTSLPGGVTVRRGADLRATARSTARSSAAPSRPPSSSRRSRQLRGDRLTALAVAVAHRDPDRRSWSPSAITSRVKRLAQQRGADGRGRARRAAARAPAAATRSATSAAALDTMRGALRQTFSALATERDRLSAIFDGARPTP